jgi:hypothetical protein
MKTAREFDEAVCSHLLGERKCDVCSEPQCRHVLRIVGSSGAVSAYLCPGQLDCPDTFQPED